MRLVDKIDKISKDQFDKAAALHPEKIEEESKEISESDFKDLLEKMQNPVQAQQEIAVNIKIFLDGRIKGEMKEKGFLSDHTRRWVESYNNILEKIQKALHGDKSVNLHLHKVSHSDISTKIKESVIVIANSKKKKVEQ